MKCTCFSNWEYKKTGSMVKIRIWKLIYSTERLNNYFPSPTPWKTIQSSNFWQYYNSSNKEIVLHSLRDKVISEFSFPLFCQHWSSRKRPEQTKRPGIRVTQVDEVSVQHYFILAYTRSKDLYLLFGFSVTKWKLLSLFLWEVPGRNQNILYV